MNFLKLLFPVLTMVLAFSPLSVSACSVCFGETDSPMAKGLNMGIFALLLVVAFVLVGFGAFFIFLIRRSAAVTALNLSAGATTSSLRRGDESAVGKAESEAEFKPPTLGWSFEHGATRLPGLTCRKRGIARFFAPTAFSFKKHHMLRPCHSRMSL